MTPRVRGVAALLFFSGACALIYQVAWFRELRLIFGASTASSAAVLAIFMGGLGLGGARLGKRADASANPLGMYAKLEIAVAIAAGATPALVWVADGVYVASGGSASLGVAGATLLRIVLTVVVLGPATFLMGGTLPAAAKAVERADDGPRKSVATLYGVNTLGAVMGTVLANFVLLEVLGTRMTLWIAALVNVLVGLTARSLARATDVAPAQARAPGIADSAAPDDVTDARDPGPAGGVLIARWFPPAASALVGCSFMLMELTWYRMLAPLLGGSSYTFGLILAVALVGIAIGGGAYASTKVTATLRWFAITCSLEALFIVIPYALGDRLAIVTALLRPLCRAGFGASTAVWTGIAAFVILPAAIVSGLQFPLVIGLYGRGSRGVGRDVGNAYLANTLGSIVGSLAGGFGLIPLLGALGVWKLVVVALAIGATVAAALDAPRLAPALRRRRALLGALLTCLPVLLLLTKGPGNVWRHSGIGAGRSDSKLEAAGAAGVVAYMRSEPRAVRWEEDGVESSVALAQLNGFTFIVNGKSDGHAIIDAPTQVMSGVLAALLHGAPKSALVVGLGTGSTAGWLGRLPTMEHVDVVELEPAILRVARDCAPVNEQVLDNPKVKIHLADAREHLRTTKDRYDIIFSEPSNPYRAGISSLYTVEYYRAAAERVAPGGMFVQWIQAYEVDGWAVATAIVTLHQIFPSVDLWETMGGDIVLVARREPMVFDAERIRATLAEPTYARAVNAVWRTRSVEGVLSHFVARSALSDILVKSALGAINTDDQNFLEFAFARNVGVRRRVDADFVDLSRRLRTDVPEVKGAVDWARVVEERWLFQESQNVALSPLPTARGPALGPVITSFGEGHQLTALKKWKDLHRVSTAFEEDAIMAEAVARYGPPEDVGLIENAPMPERDVLHAIWLGRHEDLRGAYEALLRVFIAARTNPWIKPHLLIAALSLGSEIATADPQLAMGIYEALQAPFAVEESRDARLTTAARIAGAFPDPRICVQALAKLEPPPWSRSILELRLRCYRRARDPHLAVAEADMLQLLELDTPIGASIPSPPLPRMAPDGGVVLAPQGGGPEEPPVVDAPPVLPRTAPTAPHPGDEPEGLPADAGAEGGSR